MNRSVWRSREQAALEAGRPQVPAAVPALVSRFLAARGISDPQEIELLFQPKLQELADPFRLKGMREAVARLVEAHRRQESLCVYADFDLDGTSGLALLLEGLQGLGYKNVRGYQPKRLSEGYGFHASAVEELAREGVRVIVTVDVGITALAAAERARELGVDVVLTDHHLPAAELPNVTALVNPNQGTCESELGYLCGAGVAFYLIRALKRGLVDAGLVGEDTLNLKSLLDFLTIATLTDMVPLVKDNRALVRHGLLQLSQSTRPGLKLLLEQLGLAGKELNSQDVAIKFAPKLNALSRMETGLRPIDLMRETDPARADEMVQEVLENNSNRVEMQSQGESRARDLLRDWTRSGFAFLAHSEFHRGVVGLIATRVSQERNQPAFVGSLGADGFVVGSARLPAGSELNLLDALGAVGEHLNRFGGHAGAAGFEFAMSKLDLVVEGLERHFAEAISQPRARVVDYDLDLSLGEITAQAMKWFEALGPFGQGFPQPLFGLRDVRIRDAKTLRGGHRKLWLEGIDGAGSLEALYFSPPPDLVDADFAKGRPVRLLGELQWNDFGGRRQLQFLIREMRGETAGSSLSVQVQP